MPISTPATLLWKEEFMKIHQVMMRRKDSEYFREPVDVNDLPDYPLIIKHPMDLSTVREKLERGEYPTHRELAADVRLIFTNAMVYNPQKTKAYNNAKTLGDFFEKEWASVANAQQDLLDRPPTVDMITDFVEKCHRISPDELGEVMRKLDKLCPDCLFKRPSSNEIDVNTDVLTGRIFHEINSFLDERILEMGGLITSKRLASLQK